MDRQYGQLITTVYVKFNYDRLQTDKASENFLKSDNKYENKVCSTGGPCGYKSNPV